MSEFNQSEWSELTGDKGLDIDAIFGNGSGEDVNPFEAAAQPEAVPAQDEYSVPVAHP